MKTYTWRQKNLMLQVGSLLFLLVMYHAAIKKTLLLKDRVDAAKQQELDGQDLEREWEGLLESRKRLNELAASSALDRQLLVHQQAVAFGSKVLRIPPPLRYEEQGTALLFQDYGLQGRFPQLLRTLHGLEKDRGLRLVHAAFRKEADSYTRQPHLWLHITTVNIEKHE